MCDLVLMQKIYRINDLNHHAFFLDFGVFSFYHLLLEILSERTLASFKFEQDELVVLFVLKEPIFIEFNNTRSLAHFH